MIRKYRGPVLLLAISCALSAMGGEILARTYFSNRIPDPGNRSRWLATRFDEQLGWFPRENSSKFVTTENRRFRVRHNDDGFRDEAAGNKSKPRVLVVGDSFVWGFDVEEDERFTELLQDRLAGWQILNVGVPGYGTDQEYLLLQRVFDRYQPEVVVLVYCADNDPFDNMANYRYEAYKPYFELARGTLELRGIPVPRSTSWYVMGHPSLFRSFLLRGAVKAVQKIVYPTRTIPDPTIALLGGFQDFVHTKGARLAIGMQAHDEQVASFCDAEDVPCISLDNPHVYPAVGNHWTPRGHEIVAQRLLAGLQRAGYVP